MKRIYIIHGWDGYPEECWFPWLKKQMESQGFRVEVPAMPNPEEPKIEEWVPFLADSVREPDDETFFVGHSIGNQTILRYLERLPEDIKVGGVVMVAPWMNLIEYEDAEEERIAKPWVETPIDWQKVLDHTTNFTSIFSTNDDCVPLSDKDIFEKNLGSKIIIEENKGHFSGGDGISELESVKKSLLNT